MLFIDTAIREGLMEKCLENLSKMEYPGRVIAIGLDQSAEKSVVVYAITGRSPSSQARELILEGDTIWTVPRDDEALKKGNRELLIYPAISIFGGIAVSNGRQTSDIKRYLNQGLNPVEVLKLALQDWDYEPDSPNFTPRISGCVLSGQKAALSIIKRAQDGSTERHFYEVPMTCGKGKMIATYNGENKEPLLPFAGNPLDLELEEKIPKKMAEAFYEALGPKAREKDFRVAVACIFSGNLALNEYDFWIVNRQERMETRNGKTG